MNLEQNILEVPIEDIIPNRFQPRLTFNEAGLNELSDSIKQHGIIQPIVVRKLGDKYEIIAGERRYKAATQAGLTKVPVIISDIDDNKSAEVALVENIQRRNLTAIEEAKSYKNLLDRGYLTQEQLASKMGVSQSAIANKLRLLNLDAEVQDALLNEKISERHARALLSLETKEDQRKWLQRILNERLTVRQLDLELKKLKEKNNAEEDDGDIPLVNINPNIDAILNNAEDINVVRAPHDVASMLIPDESTKVVEKSEEPRNEPVINQEQKVPNKFFNFLEDEQANMDIEDNEEIFNTLNTIPNEIPVSINNQIEEPVNLNNVEVLDDLDNAVSTIEEVVAPEITEQPTIESTEDIEPFKNMFFGPTTSVEEIEDIPTSESNNNIIEEVQPIQAESIIDPMDSVFKLEPDYEEKQEELAGTDLKSAISVFRDTIENLNNKGFSIEMEEADLEDIYHITIKINKN